MRMTSETTSGVDSWRNIGDTFTKAVVSATTKVATQIETDVTAAIASAGKFGSSWTQGVRAIVSQSGGGFNSTISVNSSVPFFSIFETGGIIKGKPYLWLPLSFSSAAGQRVSAYHGQLFLVQRKSGGPPLLFDLKTKQPLFVGLTSVTVQKKWDMASVIEKAMKEFVSFVRDGLNAS